MRIKTIERQIQEALLLEQQDHVLEHALQGQYEQVSRVVALDEEHAGERLLGFVTLYVSAIPDLLAQLRESAEELNLVKYVQPLISTVQDFFCQSFGPRAGLTSMMVKSYLAHRLFEEINDVCIFQAGEPMLPQDMSLANVIVHTLIGEPFANDLDSVVGDAVQSLLEDGYGNAIYIEPSNLVPIFQHMPSLPDQAGLCSTLH